MSKKNPEIVVDCFQCNKMGDSVELSASINAAHLHWQNERIWYQFPDFFSPYLSNSYDPFLAALLPLAMRTKSNLILRGAVSERLFVNGKQIMKIMSGWFSDFEPIEIIVKGFNTISPHSKAVGSFFTAGVDSFYTVLKNLDFYKNESRISYLLYVHGFDIKINNQLLFDIVKKEIEAVSTELNLESVFIKTNIREITGKYVPWGEQQHGAALASAGLCLSDFFKILYIPSSKPYSQLVEWGSHPLLDPLWSNESLNFIHDGNEANRSQKILWQLGKSEGAMKHLRVCWNNPDNSYNCGVCGKCIRTKINLKIAGVLDKCKTLDNHIDFKIYEDILLKSYIERRNLKTTIEFMDDHNPKFKKKLQLLDRKIQKKQNSIGGRIKKLIRTH